MLGRRHLCPGILCLLAARQSSTGSSVAHGLTSGWALQRFPNVVDVHQRSLNHLGGPGVKNDADERRHLVPVELVIAAVNVDHMVLPCHLLDQLLVLAGVGEQNVCEG